MTTILSIDQSFTSSGICIFEDGKMIHAERFVTDKALDIYERAWKVADKVVDVAKHFNVSHVGIEGLAFSKFGDATRDLAGLQFVIITRLRFIENMNVVIVPPNTVKKVATGKGNAKKEELLECLPPDIREVFDKMNLKKSTGLLDLTDAFWIGKSVENQI